MTEIISCVASNAQKEPPSTKDVCREGEVVGWSKSSKSKGGSKNLLVSIITKCGQRVGDLKYRIILWTSFMDGPEVGCLAFYVDEATKECKLGTIEDMSLKSNSGIKAYTLIDSDGTPVAAGESIQMKISQ